MVPTEYIDLAQSMDERVEKAVGSLTILFGRLEYMILLALKRKRNFTLEKALEKYKSYTLGAKLFGKNECKHVGRACQNYGAEPGLYGLCSGEVELQELCKNIQKLTSERNSLVHGLITAVDDDAVCFHNSKYAELTMDKLYELEHKVVEAIEELNRLVPIPGLTACMASGPALYVRYSLNAVEGKDPIVQKIDQS